MNTFDKFGDWTTTQWMKTSVDKYKAVDAEEEKICAGVFCWGFSVKHPSDMGINPDRLAIS